MSEDALKYPYHYQIYHRGPGRRIVGTYGRDEILCQWNYVRLRSSYLKGENSFNWELKVAHEMIFGNLGNFVALEKLLFFVN